MITLQHAELRFQDEDTEHLVVFDFEQEQVAVASSTGDPRVIFPNPKPRRWKPCVRHCVYLIAKSQVVILNRKAEEELKELQQEREIQGRSY